MHVQSNVLLRAQVHAHMAGRKSRRARRGIEDLAMDAHDGLPPRVWTFAETDYLFGAGVLRMVIEGVDWTRPRTHDGETWYDVHGVEISNDGRVVGPRQTTVKASRLKAG
jgi:hypothetical protein